MVRRGFLLALISLWFAPAPSARAQDLLEALATAYQSNPTLLAARAELRAVNEGVSQELSNYRPFVSIEGQGGVQELETETAAGGEITYPFLGSIGLTQPLYRGGRTVAGVARAEADVAAQRAVLASVEQGVLLSAVTAYMDVWRDEAVLGLTVNNERVLTRQLEATRDRFEVGELTRTDVAQAQSRLARATAARVAAEGDLAASRAVYLEVVGAPAGTLAAPAEVEGLPGSQSDAILIALENNPEIEAAMASERSARHQIRVSTGALLPQVSLSVELLHSENAFTNRSESDRARVLAIVSVPLYQQGLVSSQVREAKQAANQRRIETEGARRRIRRETIDAWEELNAARAQIQSFIAASEAAATALEGVRQEADVGTRTILDILDAEQELLDAQVSLVRARRDEIVAGFRLLQTQGRLTAAELGLPVAVYDPEADYEAVRDRWFGLSAPGE